MKFLKMAAATLSLLMGWFSTACAQAEKPPPPREYDSREAVRQLETEIQKLEPALENKEATPEQRKEWKGRLKEALAEPAEVREHRHPQEGQDRVRRLESQYRELEGALESKDGSAEKRDMWAKQLDKARLEPKYALAALQEKGPPPKEHYERLMARLREIEALMKKVGPEEQKELAQEAEKIRAELKRGDPKPWTKTGPPMDPEVLRLHGEIKELEYHSQELGMKLRSLPATSKDERAEIQAKMKEAVTKLFDLREQARAKEVEDLKRRLEELTRLLDKRKANRDQIIEKRIRQLSGEQDELDW